MNGSRMGRNRMGRVLLLGCGIVSLSFLVLLYRSASAEIFRLKDLHFKCAQQQEALAAQLQVVFTYKEQLEKTLTNEKSANEAAKEELQKKASRERERRDKDSQEAMQRFNALQQSYNILKAERQDLEDDCKKKETIALESSKGLESKLQELRKKVSDDKKAIEQLKNKYEQLQQDKEQLDDKYDSLMKAQSQDNGSVQHLQKLVLQLQRELDEAKKSAHFVGMKNDESHQLPRGPDSDLNLDAVNSLAANDEKSPLVGADQAMQMAKPVSPKLQQGSRSSNNAVGAGVLQQANNVSSSSTSSTTPSQPLLRVKLPQGVPPIPKIYDSAGAGRASLEGKDEDLEPRRQLQPPGVVAAPMARPKHQMQGREAAINPPLKLAQVQRKVAAPNEERAADEWFKLKPGVQEVGDPHHFEKSGFEHGNEDVEQYDEYNYKEDQQNKNADLHLEEGEDEREDEDDYIHNNNANVVKHE
ncbi:hypothetical protein QAD02_024368 [Eretmocerus hayati]|uniref:Uncharacterized protein n=1 Tax=Eretmocerus hayati TaxID=131215 RepID=A0ACC2Q056_9HYME|nr:hypothetical protein QAD02_024368 [Eretmocerus hayati]